MRIAAELARNKEVRADIPVQAEREDVSQPKRRRCASPEATRTRTAARKMCSYIKLQIRSKAPSVPDRFLQRYGASAAIK